MFERETIGQLKQLRTIQPRPDWQVAARTALLRQVAPAAVTPVRLGAGQFLSVLTLGFRQQLFQPVVMMLLVLGTFLGSSLVVNAAFYSLPGARLYPMKLALEKTQIAITPDEEKQVELKIEFVRKRVEEFDKLAAQPTTNPEERSKSLARAATELSRNVADVQQHIGKLASQNSVPGPEREKTLRIAFSVQQEADELVKKLDEQTTALVGVAGIEQAVGDQIALVRQSVEETNQVATHLLEDVDDLSTASSTPVLEIPGQSTTTASSTTVEASDSEAPKTPGESTVETTDPGVPDVR